MRSNSQNVGERSQGIQTNQLHMMNVILNNLVQSPLGPYYQFIDPYQQGNRYLFYPKTMFVSQIHQNPFSRWSTYNCIGLYGFLYPAQPVPHQIQNPLPQILEQQAEQNQVGQQNQVGSQMNQQDQSEGQNQERKGLQMIQKNPLLREPDQIPNVIDHAMEEKQEKLIQKQEQEGEYEDIDDEQKGQKQNPVKTKKKKSIAKPQKIKDQEYLQNIKEEVLIMKSKKWSIKAVASKTNLLNKAVKEIFKQDNKGLFEPNKKRAEKREEKIDEEIDEGIDEEKDQKIEEVREEK